MLFPFDGRREQAAPCGLSMTLYKYLYDIEESRFPHFVSWRMAAHLGEVAWREHATGTLVSETLNSVFHLGQQFVPAGSFHVTDDIHALAGARCGNSSCQPASSKAAASGACVDRSP